MKRTKQIIARALVLFMALTIAACSGNSPSPDGTVTPAPPPSDSPATGGLITPAPPPADSPAPGGTVTPALPPADSPAPDSTSSPAPQPTESPAPGNDNDPNPGDSGSEAEDNGYVIQSYTNMVNRYPATDIAFIITAKHGRYHFSDSEMPLVMACKYVDAFESGISYAKEGLGLARARPLVSFYYQDDLAKLYGVEGMTSGGGAFQTSAWVVYDYSTVLSPFEASHILMHEAVHVFCDVFSINSNFPELPKTSLYQWAKYFEEGLATMLEHMYGYDNRKLYDVYAYHFTDSGSMPIEGALDKVGDVAEALNHLALRRSFEEHDFEDASTYGDKYAVLQSYYTSASFLYYLLGQSTQEDFLHVYADIDLMQETYGKDMDGMIEEWLDYLEQYA